MPENLVARFRPLTIGLQDRDQVEILTGLEDGESVITTGSAALRDGDRIALPGQQAPSSNAQGEAGRGGRGKGGRGKSAPGGDARPANNNK